MIASSLMASSMRFLVSTSIQKLKRGAKCFVFKPSRAYKHNSNGICSYFELNLVFRHEYVYG